MQLQLQNNKGKLQFAVIIVAVLVEIIYISKGALLVYRYSHRSKVCVNHTIEPAEDDDSLEFEKDDRGYDFTVFLVAIISLLRCIEYIPLFIRLWQYWKKTDGPSDGELKQCKHYLIFVLLIPVWAISMSLPAVGLSLEERCGDAKVMANVFIAYCSINFLRYTWAFSVRTGMVYATLKVKKIWNKAVADLQNANEENTMSQNANEENTMLLHARLTDIYTNAGEEVKKIARIFETWFLFPWVIFFLISSLKAKNILSLWNDDAEEVELRALVYFMLYNFNQMIFLLIPYLCAKKMNHDHHQCVLEIQKKQLNTERGEEFVAEQRKLLIQVDENYDVEPRVWGLGFKVKMNNFMYILCLVLGLVFTILTPLLY